MKYFLKDKDINFFIELIRNSPHLIKKIAQLSELI